MRHIFISNLLAGNVKQKRLLPLPRVRQQAASKAPRSQPQSLCGCRRRAGPSGFAQPGFQEQKPPGRDEVEQHVAVLLFSCVFLCYIFLCPHACCCSAPSHHSGCRGMLSLPGTLVVSQPLSGSGKTVVGKGKLLTIEINRKDDGWRRGLTLRGDFYYGLPSGGPTASSCRCCCGV